MSRNCAPLRCSSLLFLWEAVLDFIVVCATFNSQDPRQTDQGCRQSEGGCSLPEMQVSVEQEDPVVCVWKLVPPVRYALPPSLCGGQN